jgi:hypothetical protein
MNVSLLSGKVFGLIDATGYGQAASYSALNGISLEKTNSFAFITTSGSKVLRKLKISNGYAGPSITSTS